MKPMQTPLIGMPRWRSIQYFDRENKCSLQYPLRFRSITFWRTKKYSVLQNRGCKKWTSGNISWRLANAKMPHPKMNIEGWQIWKAPQASKYGDAPAGEQNLANSLSIFNNFDFACWATPLMAASGSPSKDNFSWNNRMF